MKIGTQHPCSLGKSLFPSYLPIHANLHHSRCIGHIVQLAIKDFMTAVTQVGLVESKQAMWEYDPKVNENRVLCGGLDVITAIWTLTIKVQLFPTIHLTHLLHTQCLSHRFKLRPSARKHLSKPKSSSISTHHSSSPFTRQRAGGALSRC